MSTYAVIYLSTAGGEGEGTGRCACISGRTVPIVTTDSNSCVIMQSTTFSKPSNLYICNAQLTNAILEFRKLCIFSFYLLRFTFENEC